MPFKGHGFDDKETVETTTSLMAKNNTSTEKRRQAGYFWDRPRTTENKIINFYKPCSDPLAYKPNFYFKKVTEGNIPV